MPEWLTSAAEQAPALAILVALVVLFMRYVGKTQEMQSASQEKQNEVIERIADRANNTAAACEGVIRENSAAFGRVAGIMDRVERRLEKLEREVSEK